MSNPSAGSVNSKKNHTDIDPEIEKLKELVFKGEINRIEELEKRISKELRSTKSVSDVIAEAIVMRSGKDNMVSAALSPIVENSLQEALRKRPQDFISVIFPIVGSLIRRSISETFSSMLGSFSKSLEFSFSPRGIKWRIEAIRSGKSFSEIVMLHTVIYRVEQIYLIHSESGLVLSNLVNKGVHDRDADMISGMLTAIQDFARDCFASAGDTGSLNSLDMGDYTIYIERSPLAYIACVVRGQAPKELLVKLRETLELILAKFHDILQDYNGDDSPFIAAAPYLEDCFSEQLIEEKKKISFVTKIFVGILMLFILSGIGYKIYHSHRMNSIITLITDEPGYILINSESHLLPKPWELAVLKDPFAAALPDLLESKGFAADEVICDFISIDSRDPEIVMKKLQSKLSPPLGVYIKYDSENDAYHMIGSADYAWISGAKAIAYTIPGVNNIDTTGLVDPRFKILKELKREIEGTVIRFARGAEIPLASDQHLLEEVSEKLVELEKLTNSMGIAINLTIYGHADTIGTEAKNYAISQARAQVLAAKLYAKGSNIPISLYAMGSSFADTTEPEDQASRKIEMRIYFSNKTGIDF
jgi:OOP family OmpA-OmpF porin